MRIKSYKMRGIAVKDGLKTYVDLPLEIEGKRAFVIWDTINLGAYQFKARLEIDPRMLQKVQVENCQFTYSGDLVLPRPQNN